MPTFLETLGFVVYLSVMYGGSLNREVLAAAYSVPEQQREPLYRGVRTIAFVRNDDQLPEEQDGEAAA